MCICFAIPPLPGCRGHLERGTEGRSWAWTILGGRGLGEGLPAWYLFWDFGVEVHRSNLGWKGLEIRVGVSHPGMVETGG